MHGSPPKLMIIARREAAGPEMPYFSGPSFLDAKKMMVHGSDCAPDPADKQDMGHKEEMMEIAKQLKKASNLHNAQADRLIALAAKIDGESADDSESEKDDSYSEAKDLK